MSRPIIREHNLETNEIIDREMNEVEFAKYQADKEAEIQHQAEAATRAVARQAILDRLGLTEDEAKILLG